MSPATLSFAGESTTTAIGNADTSDGVFTENTALNTTFEQDTTNAVIHWDVMNQQADNTLSFIQNRGESVLNQASGISASVFRGMVRCDASCVFANEAGVTFADGSYIDVGRLVAVAGRVSEQEFRAGDLHAMNVVGEVHNLGEIHADSVALIGARLSNSGEIYIADGTLTAVVGEEVWLREHDSNVVIRARLPELGSDESFGGEFNELPAIDNSGTIEAGSGSVRLLAGDLLSFAIRNQGRIQANAISLEGGDGGLVEVSGSGVLDATNTTPGGVGGTIEVLGDYVAIADEAVLDASGSAGGGEILVGGDRGGASGTRTSRATYVGKNTSLRADASEAGDGGKVIVWSDGTTRSHGTITARGGLDSGNGGFVETSGLEFLDVSSSPAIHARSGNAEDLGGEWLLDPFNIDIVDSCAGDCLGEELDEDESYNPDLIFNPTLRADSDIATSEIEVGLIKSVLQTGSNVTITTQGEGKDEGIQVGDIRLATDLSFDPIPGEGAPPDTEATLTLLAANDIMLNGAIVNNDDALTLNLDFRANSGQPELEAADDELDNQYVGDLTLNQRIDSGGGSVTLRGANVTLDDNIETDGGSVVVVAEGGDANLNALIDTRVYDPGTGLPDVDEQGGNASIAALARVAPSPDPDNDDEDLILGGDIRVAAGSEVHSGGGTIGLLAGSSAFANTGDSTGGNVFLDGLLDSGGGSVTLEATRSLSISERETHNFGGLIQIGRDAVIETNGGQVDVRSQTDPAATTLHDGKTTVRIFGEIDTRVYDPVTTLLDLNEQGGEIDILSDGSFGRVELNYLRGDTDPMLASNGGDVSILSNGSTTLVQGTIDTHFAGSVLPDEDEIAGEIEIASVSLTSLQAVAGNGIRLLADRKLELTAGLDGVQNLRFDTRNGTITLGANVIELRAGNGLGSFSTSQVDFGSADSGLQLTDAAGDANPLELLIGQDAAIGSDNLPDADQFIDGVIDVEKLTLQSFDRDIQLANIAITASDELTLSAREGIAIDQATTSLNVGSSLNLEVYDAFSVDDALALAINNAAPEINITAGALDTIANLGEAGLTIDAAVLSAGDSLLLHAGAGGAGDLSFENDPTLIANEITLWAGDGSSLTDTPQVVAVDPDDGSDRVGFTLPGGARAFTLRQSASISDDTIPNASQFNGGVAGLRYTLRSDAGAIGGEDTIDPAKLGDTFLSLYSRNGIDLDFDPGVGDGTLQVRGLDIGGLESFTYTRALNEQFDIVDPGNETVLVIRAGLSGLGDLFFDGSVEEGEPDESFDIDADEIRLIAGDGLAGAIDSRIRLDSIAGTTPTFRGSAGGAVKRFVFRQDEAISEGDLPLIPEFFADTSPETYVVHSDYDSLLESEAPRSAIQLDSFDDHPTATMRLILSGESVTISREDGEDLDLVSDFNPDNNLGFILEIRTDTLDLRAVDTDDLADPVGIFLDELALSLSDFARYQDDEELAQPLPALFDIDTLPPTVPNVVSLFQEADIEATTLSALRDVLGVDLTKHDGPVDDPDIDPDEEPLILFLESLEANIELDSMAVADTDLRLTLRAENAKLDWIRTPAETYNLENLILNADHSLVFGDTPASPSDPLNVSAQNLIEITTGNAGSDGDLGFGEDVHLSANQILLRAGLNGVLAGDGASPSVDVETNNPTFLLVDLSEDGNPSDSVFEIRQDAGFVDDADNIENAESLIILANQIDGADELGAARPVGTVRLVSDAGNITIANLSTTFDRNSIARLDLQAGGADPLDRGTIIIMDGAAVDTDLTLYDGIEITSDEIILAANGMGTVIAHDPDVLFRDISTNSGSDPLRFTIRHDQSDICESVAGCGTGALPSLDQFVTPVSSQSVDYTLQSISGFVELTSQIAHKLTAGTNSSPRQVDLTLLGNDQAGDVDVLISANVLGRDADVHLSSLVVGEVNDPLRIEFAAMVNESVHLATTGNQTYYGQVKIDGATVLTGDTLHFTDDITADTLSGNDADLTLNVREHLRLDRDIDLDRAAGKLRINLDPNADALARVEFGRDGFDQTVTANRVEIFATREKDLGEGDGFFPGNARSSKVATIGKRSGDLDFAVDSFSMSEGEKLSVGGALTIGDAATLEAWIGDLSALTIDVIADAITIVLRESGRYLGLDGSVEGDAGVDLVANTIHLDGEIDTVGDGRAPSFGLLDPFAADDNLARFPVAGLNPDNLPIRASDFDWNLADAPPDLHPNGATRDDFSNIYFGKEVVPAPNAWRADRLLPADDEHLARIDIELRDDSLQTLRSRLEGAGITDDVSSDLPSRESSRVTISTSRILAKDAESVATRYIRLFGEDGSRTDEVKRALSAALDDYRLISGTRRVLGFEFRRFLRNRPSSQFDAYLALEDLDALFSYHRNLGLTPGEYNRIQLRWLESIKPDGISLEELAEAVHPSRFIRGSDILDIFGE